MSSRMRMRVLVGLVALAVLVVAFVLPATASKNGKSGLPTDGREYLYEKTSQSTDALIVSGGSRGRLTYTLTGTNELSRFVFNGYDVIPSINYALVNYLGDGKVAVLGRADANGGGHVHIAGHTDDPLRSDGARDGDARIWLVPSYDLAGSSIATWDIQGMLFEADGIELN